MIMIRAISQVFKNFFKHDCLYLATNISFCALFSLIPLTLIVFAIVGFVLGSSQGVYHQLLHGIDDWLPHIKTFLAGNVREVVGERHSFGIWGVVLLIFFATLFFRALERAFNVIFEADKSRNFFYSQFLSVSLIVMISFFFFMPTAADLLTRSLSRFSFIFPLGDIFRGKVFFILFSYLSFVLIILFVPHHRIKFRYAALGGVIFALGLFIMKQIVRWYMFRALDEYNLIFGSLTAYVLLLLWVYYVSNILLFAAEWVAYLQLRPPLKRQSRS